MRPILNGVVIKFSFTAVHLRSRQHYSSIACGTNLWSDRSGSEARSSAGVAERFLSRELELQLQA